MEALLSECIIANQSFQLIEQLKAASAARQLAAQNWTLSLIYEELQFSMFSNDKKSSYSQGIALDFRMKGDAVESFIGELYKFITCDPSTLNIEWQQMIPIAYEVIHKIVAHALYRGQFLLSAFDTNKILADAIKPGGGGILHSIGDIKAIFCNKADDSESASDVNIAVEEKQIIQPQPPICVLPGGVDDAVQHWAVEMDRYENIIALP